MAHAVESMMYVGETPWHGLGKKVAKAPNAQEAMKLAGLNWNVKLVPLHAEDGQIVTHRAVMRETDSRIFGVVGPKYEPLQNIHVFDWFNPFISSGEAQFETAGSLHDGSRIWALAKINRDPIEVVKGDEVNKYILLSNTHDGTKSARVMFTPIRVVCQNTLAMAEDHTDTSMIRVSHSKNVKENMEAIRDIISTANAQFEATAEQYKFLAKKKINKKDLDRYVTEIFFPAYVEKKEEEISERQQKRIADLNGKIVSLFESGRGNKAKNVAGTWWAAYNAVTEYLTHQDKSDVSKRLDSLWFGQNGDVNNDALDTALEMNKYAFA